MKSGFVGTALTVAADITLAQSEGPGSGFNTFYELALSDWEQAVGQTCPRLVGTENFTLCSLTKKAIDCLLSIAFVFSETTAGRSVALCG
jgi:hypothetical protein